MEKYWRKSSFFLKNSILQLFDMILRKEQNTIIKWANKKNGNWTPVYLKYFPHGSAQWRDNENGQTLKYSKKSNPASLCQI